MSGIILPESEKEEVEKLEYKPTEEDEEKFFLIYHLNIQPSEVDQLKPEYRRYLIQRFIGQKQLEQQAREQHQLMRQIGPSLIKT